MATTITKMNTMPTEEELAQITLDARKFVPADSRYISRLLKAAGLQRAERLTGTSGQYSFGYNVSDGSVSVYGYSYRGTVPPEAEALIEDAVQVLRDHGFTVTGHGVSGRHVYNEVEDFYWPNLRLGVYVGMGDTLVRAYDVPAFRAEEARLQQERIDTEAREKTEREERQAVAEEIADNLMSMIDHRVGSLEKATYVAVCKTLALKLTSKANKS